MKTEEPVTRTLPNSNNNKNSVNVNNHFNLTINLGDSLNLLALIAGIYVIRKLTVKPKAKKTKM
ncbi:hypothetical protein [Bacillus sp. MRMR6]|uniref:hypothetical protein n=1 Tax=Bacillus sp. MRMR6 TaxID=1928617 RepID=UPI0009534DC0|nr:hypothetical protein [Bacillus sp. MRMR6]OLS40384.1 hypothetical protein BTR25_09495 [Bacillus sp. MRMR6]